jgi:CRP/FNR family transcriptional regulator
MRDKFILNQFSFLGNDFLNEFQNHAIVDQVKAKAEIIRERQRIKHIVFLLNGLLKVYTLNDGRELTYYYIKPEESCLVTFSSIFNNYISTANVVAEEDSLVILIPVSIMEDWLIRFPEINRVFYKEYNKRFSDVMNVVNDAVFHKLDKRVISYIKQQITLKGNNAIKLTHREIAETLGTSREVISRVIKKMESEGEILRTKDGFKVPVNKSINQLSEMS